MNHELSAAFSAAMLGEYGNGFATTLYLVVVCSLVSYLIGVHTTTR